MDNILGTVQQSIDSILGTNSQPQHPQSMDDILGNNQSQAASWDDFKNRATSVANQRHMPQAVLPVMLSQAAVESARGKSAPGNNYFGIKGSGNAGSNNLATQEYGNGSYHGETSNFAGYKTPEDSVNAYLDLISGYKGVPEAIQSGNPDAIARAIEANGYATSPTYVNTIESTPEFRGQ